MKMLKTWEAKRLAILGMFLGSYAAIKIAAFICATILVLRVHWALGGALFALALFVRFEFRYTGGDADPPKTEATG